MDMKAIVIETPCNVIKKYLINIIYKLNNFCFNNSYTSVLL